MKMKALYESWRNEEEEARRERKSAKLEMKASAEIS